MKDYFPDLNLKCNIECNIAMSEAGDQRNLGAIPRQNAASFMTTERAVEEETATSPSPQAPAAIECFRETG